MNYYIYRYIDELGKKRWGFCEGYDKVTCYQHLGNQGIFPLQLVQVPLVRKKGLKHQEFALLLKHLAMSMEQGLPLMTCFHYMKQEYTSSRLQRAIISIEEGMLKGWSFAEVMKDAQLCEPMFTHWIAVGEKQGRLAQTLHDIHDYLVDYSRMKKKLQQQLVYPLTVLAGLLGLGGLIFFVVLPILAQQFIDLETTLPWILRVPFIAHQLWSQYHVGLVILVLGSVCWIGYQHRQIGVEQWFRLLQRRLLRQRWVRKMAALTVFIPFARLLGQLLASGVSVQVCLEALNQHFRASFFRQDIYDITARIEQGLSISKAIQESVLFPPMAKQMVANGERYGRLSESLLETAIYYEEMLLDEMTMLLRLVEPIMIVLLGLMVLGIALGLFLPILESYQLALQP